MKKIVRQPSPSRGQGTEGGQKGQDRQGGQDGEPGELELPEPTLELEATLYTLEQLKAAAIRMPQLALVGRSNVGKSSLLNALARRRNLAKISSTPGKTRSVNLFLVRPDGFHLTDLPGYGYARRGKEERQAWGRMIETYLLQSPMLRAVVLLLDCRLPPQESDKIMADFALAHGLPLISALTKADKCNRRERAARQKEWAMFLRGDLPLPVSAHTGLGLPDLWLRLREAAARPGEGGDAPQDAAPSSAFRHEDKKA